jgi:uncharacterized protein YecT (DUF1311 family)
MRALFFVATSLGAIAQPLQALGASADEPRLSAAYEQCIKKAEAVTPSLMKCESEERERQDKRLNAAYQALLSKLTKAKAEELRKVQRAWLVYSEAKCGFWYDSEEFSGQLERLIASHCSVVERARRATELEVLAKH